ncbi:MAG: ATP-binding protein [Thermodesulfobacteriota bacterium]
MQFRTRISLSLIVSGLVSVALLVAVSLVFTANEIKSLNLRVAQEMTASGAGLLSSYFQARKAEISAYAHMPLLRTMHWGEIAPFLKAEEARHRGTYEKMLLALPDPSGHYYITTEGNPHFGGLLSFDNSSPTAKLKSIAQRDYWRHTVAENRPPQERLFVSTPMISYFTGVRQIMVASSILSEDGSRLLGMVAGSIEWTELERVIDTVAEKVLSRFGKEARLFLISHDGTYVYHFDPAKAIRLKVDEQGRPILTEIGEKSTESHTIGEETDPVLAGAGKEMLAGKSGDAHLDDMGNGEPGHLFYAPVESAGYSLGVLVPMRVVMTSLRQFYLLLAGMAATGMAIIGIISLIVSRQATKPLATISAKAAELAAGDWNTRMAYQGSDELAIVANSFNRMVDQLHQQAITVAEAHDRLLTIMDSLDAIVYVADMQSYELLFVNTYAKRLFGDITGKICWQSLQQGQNGPCPFCTNPLLVDEKGEPRPPHVWEFQNTVTGQWFYIQDKAIPWVDGRLVRFEIATDITARKQAEAGMARLAAIIEQSDALIAIAGEDGLLRYLNHAGRTLLDLSADASITGIATRQLLPDASQEPNSRQILAAFAGGTPWHGEAELCPLPGQEDAPHAIPVEMSVFPLGDQDGRGAFSVAIIANDIRQRKRSEEQLRHSQKMEAIGTLAGGIAHDFNNLLYAIQGNAELGRIAHSQGKSNQSHLEEILKASRRAADLVKQILAFSRKMTPEKSPLALQSLAKETIRFLRGTIPTTIEINADIHPDCRPILADATQIHQVIMNLCTNAWHAMQDQESGRLRVEVEEISLNEREAGALELSKGSYVRLAVSDTGHGIDPAIQKRIFEPYFTTKEMGRGTGLGLATVQGIVKDHQGAIRVRSIVGQGTTMEVFLPVQLEAEQPARPDLEAQPRFIGEAMQGGHALVVDDEEMLASLEKTTLESAGWRVSAFTSSGEALAAFEQRPEDFDLVITDQTMPELTGAKLAAAILARRPQLPIILATGYSEVIDEQGALRLGIKGFLMKPFTSEELLLTIQKLLG